MADKLVAHTENVPEDKPIPIATYNDMDEALGVAIRGTDAVRLSVLRDGDIVAGLLGCQHASLSEGYLSTALTLQNK